MSDISSVGSFQFDFQRSNVGQQDPSVQQQEDARRLQEQQNTDANEQVNGGQGRTEDGGAANENNSGGNPQDQIRISTEAQDRLGAGSEADTADRAVGSENQTAAIGESEETGQTGTTAALGETEETDEGSGSQQENSRVETAGNTRSSESEQSRTLGQVVDVFA